MCRINPYAVRIADIGNNKEYWIVEADKVGDLHGKKPSNTVRPKRILFLKEIPQNKIPLNPKKITNNFNLSIDEAKQFLLNICNISPSILDAQGNAQTRWRIGIKSGLPRVI